MSSRSSYASHFAPRGRGGGYRGSARGGYGTHYGSVPTVPGKDRLQGLQPAPLQTIRRPAPVSKELDVVCSNVEYVASYNWTDSDEPTIIVPGSPRHWTEKSLPVKVSRDSGTAYVDQNSHRIPAYPLLPLFRAADIMEETRKISVGWDMVDVVTDRNNLRKLFSWIEGSDDDFRIDVQLAGTWTILFQRWEERATEEARPGYSDSFERTMTRPAPGCERGTLTGHHRIIKYDLGDLKLVVRCEVDACYPRPNSGASRTLKNDNTSSADLDNLLTSGLSSLSFSRSASSPSSMNLHVIRAGEEVPQSSLIKLKTRSEQNAETYDWASAYPQLLFGQTANTLVGVHRRGEFFEVRKTKLDSPALTVHKAKAQPGMNKLKRLLEEIRGILQGQGGKAALSLVCTGGVLQVMEWKTPTTLLPQSELKKHF